MIVFPLSGAGRLIGHSFHPGTWRQLPPAIVVKLLPAHRAVPAASEQQRGRGARYPADIQVCNVKVSSVRRAFGPPVRAR